MTTFRTPSRIAASAFHANYEEEAARLRGMVEEQSLALLGIAQRDRIIGDIGLAIRTSLDPDQIEVQAVQLLGATIGADHCIFGHTDIDVNHLRVGQGYSRPGVSPLSGDYKPADYVDFHRLFFAGGTISVRDAAAEDLPQDTVRFLASLGVAAAIAVPLFRDGRLEAVLCVAMEQPHEWSEHDASLVETVAAQTRTGIETAAVVQRERRIASTLEQALLPPLPSTLPGLQLAYAYRAALDESDVGGDFYAAYSVSDHRHALVIGDVSGKGLAAASQVAALQSMLRYAVLSAKNLVDAISQMNHVVAEHDLLDGFATLFIGIFDDHNNSLHYCSCGHEPPFIFTESRIEILETCGPPIGATPSVRYTEGFVQLKPNDLIMLYTDGLSEAGPDRRTLLGQEGLAEILRRRGYEGEPADIAGNIIGDVVGFANGRLRDDACLIIGKVSEAGRPEADDAQSATNTFESLAGQSQETPAEEQLRLLVDSVTDYAIFLLDRTGHIRTWNRGAERLKGYTAAEVVGKHFSIFYTPEDVQRGHPLDELAIATAEGRYEEEGWRVRKDGTRFWASVVITALRDTEGKLCGFGKVTRDFSERRRSEQLLRRSEERFRQLVQGVREYAIFMIDPSGNVVSWNEGAERMKGYTAHDAIGLHFSAFYTPEDLARDHPAHELAIATAEGSYREEGWRVRKDGTRFWANVLITALRDEAGSLYGFAKVTQDLTERRA